MALIIVLNALFALGVIAVVVSPLVWAIFTQHRDHVAVATVPTRPAPRPEYARMRRHAGIPATRVAQPSKA